MKFDRIKNKPADDQGSISPPESLESLIVRLLDSKDEKTQKRFYKIFSQAMIEAGKNSGGVYYENINDFYQNLEKKEYLARRENPQKVIESIFKKQDIELKFEHRKLEEEGKKYANAVEWEPTGYKDQSLRSAFLEGWGRLSGLVTVIGFDKGPDLQVTQLSDDVKKIGNLVRNNVVATEGKIHPENIRFIIFKAPKKLVPEEMITEADRETFEIIDEQVEKRIKHAASVKGKVLNETPVHDVFRGIIFP